MASARTDEVEKDFAATEATGLLEVDADARRERSEVDAKNDILTDVVVRIQPRRGTAVK